MLNFGTLNSSSVKIIKKDCVWNLYSVARVWCFGVQLVTVHGYDTLHMLHVTEASCH